MLAIPAVGIALWLILPHTPAVVAILVVYVLAAGAGGLWRISTAQERSAIPSRNPQPPPGRTPPSTS
ncbi:MAG TPA: hypothetical protein VFC22_05045 [Solirubrobacteraceae bacterium]|nr:hypothetical protein [Solirubrobacteraceae bacterium]